MKSAQTSSMFTSLTETEEASLCGGTAVSVTQGTVTKGKTGKNASSGKKGAAAVVKKVTIVKSITTTTTTTTTTTIPTTAVVTLDLASLFL
ncbi:hypothetical protein [Nostoc sp.]|uniref:hypothetical protein n=1 Tax=Nostoc sp. TaxID=1180 RepID=UPI002FF8508A